MFLFKYDKNSLGVKLCEIAVLTEQPCRKIESRQFSRQTSILSFKTEFVSSVCKHLAHNARRTSCCYFGNAAGFFS